MLSKKDWVLLFAVVVLIVVSLFLEPIVDRVIGNNDGVFTYLHYFNFALVLFFLFYVCTRIPESVSKFLFPLLSVVFTVWILEFIFFAMNSRKKNGPAEPDVYVNGVKGKVFNEYNEFLGAKAIADAVVDFKKPGTDSSLFIYTFNSTGFRSTVQDTTRTDGRRNVFFYGCSFTMGYYLPDSSTIASLFAREDTNSIVSNYGFNGYGTQQLFSMLQHEVIKSKGSDSGNSVMFYIYLDDHIRRTIIDMVKLNTWEEKWPYYQIENGKYAFYSSLKQARPLQYAVYKFLYKSEILRYFEISLPLFITANDYKFVAGMIGEERKLYSKLFKSENFYVVIYPGSKNNIVSYLKLLGIKCIDLSAILDMQQKKFQTPGSFHPSQTAHEIVLDTIVKHVSR